MTDDVTQSGGPPGGTDHPAVGALAAQYVALSTDVESLRKLFGSLQVRVADARTRIAAVDDRLDGVTGKLDGIAETLAGLAEQVAEVAQESEEDAALKRQSWLAGVRDPMLAGAVLTRLTSWLAEVYLRYPGTPLPACWLWHPWVVEELLWLWRSWVEAYTGKTAAARLAADWHDRLRPGVTRRVAELKCSLDRHAPGPDGSYPEVPSAAPRVPLAGSAGSVVQWWTTDRTAAAPYPTPDQLAEAEGLR